VKYFTHKGIDYRCSDIFNWRAITPEGRIMLYEKRPFISTTLGTWESLRNSYNYEVHEHFLDIYKESKPCNNWRETLTWINK